MYFIFTENYKQWKTFLMTRLTERIHKFFTSLFKHSRKTALDELSTLKKLTENEKREIVYKRFQTNCNKLQDWSIRNFQAELDYYDQEIPKFDRVLLIFFQLNFKVLSMSRLNQNTKFKFPKIDKSEFIKKCYLTCASEVCYKYPFLFDEDINILQSSKNLKEATKEIDKVLKLVIFNFVPIDQFTERKKPLDKGNKQADSSVDPKEAALRIQLKKEELKTLGYNLEDIQNKKKIQHGYKKKEKPKQYAEPQEVYASGSKVIVAPKNTKQFKENLEEWIEQTESMLEGMNQKELNQKEIDVEDSEPLPVSKAVSSIENQENVLVQDLNVLPPTKENLKLLDKFNEEHDKRIEFKPPTFIPVKKVPSQEKPSVCDTILAQVTSPKEKQKEVPSMAIKQEKKPNIITPKRSSIVSPPKPVIQQIPIKTTKEPKKVNLKKEEIEEEEKDIDNNSVIIESKQVSRKSSTVYGESEPPESETISEGENEKITKESDSSYSNESTSDDSKSEKDVGVDINS